MARVVGLIAVALLGVGCATSSSVKEQIDPLSQRLTNVERQNQALEAKVADLNQKADTQAADVQALRKDLANANAAAEKAQQAAADAQQAASRAETAADKSTKAFELRQAKGVPR